MRRPMNCSVLHAPPAPIDPRRGNGGWANDGWANDGWLGGGGVSGGVRGAGGGIDAD